jgi:hypothetical protein
LAFSQCHFNPNCTSYEGFIVLHHSILATYNGEWHTVHSFEGTWCPQLCQVSEKIQYDAY